MDEVQRFLTYSCLPNKPPGLNKRPGGNFLKSYKRPALNKCPGMKFFSEFSVATTYFLTFFTFPCLNETHVGKYVKNSPALNKSVLGGKLTKNNKNVLDYYSGDKSIQSPTSIPNLEI